jgi:chromosome segregation ATPase
MQSCIEENVFPVYTGQGGEGIRTAIADARKFDISYLPEKLRKDVAESFDKAAATFPLVEDIARTLAVVDAATPVYQPLHIKVRQIQADIFKLDLEARDLATSISRTRGDDAATTARKAVLEKRLADRKARIEDLRKDIPANWEADHKAFADLQKTDKLARAKYRRNVDDAYGPLKELLATIEGTDALAETKPVVEDLRGTVVSATPDEAADRISEASKRLGDIEGTSEIRSALTAARRAIKNNTPDAQEAAKQIDAAVAALGADLAWRQRAKSDLLPELRRYDAAIKDTIGLRSQPRLPRAQALDVAACQSHHRDISLGF